MPDPTAYDTDFYLWTQQQAALLRQGEFNRVDLDVENIAEEIESMGRREKHSIRGYLFNVMLHLLKWRYQPERRETSWELSLINGRDQLNDLAKDSPSLRPLLPALVADLYPRVRRNMAGETGLPLATFPDQCPFTVEQVLDAEYWPD